MVGLISRALPPRVDPTLYRSVEGVRAGWRTTKIGCIASQQPSLPMSTAPDGPGCRRPIQERVGEEQRASGRSRLHAKLQDLARQYTHARVTIVWLQTLKLVIPVHFSSSRVRGARPISGFAGWSPARPPPQPPVREGHARHRRPRLMSDVPNMWCRRLGTMRGLRRDVLPTCHPGGCHKCAAHDRITPFHRR